MGWCCRIFGVLHRRIRMLRSFICFHDFLSTVWCTRDISPSSKASTQWSPLSCGLYQRSRQWKCTCSQGDHLLCWIAPGHRRTVHGYHRRCSQVHSPVGHCFLQRGVPWLFRRSCGDHAQGGSICPCGGSPSSRQYLMQPWVDTMMLCRICWGWVFLFFLCLIFVVLYDYLSGNYFLASFSGRKINKLIERDILLQS